MDQHNDQVASPASPSSSTASYDDLAARVAAIEQTLRDIGRFLDSVILIQRR